MYGCLKTIRLPYIRGIGHVDETLKFMDDTTILTDEKRYKETLEDHGFTVHMLPRADKRYETYANSLLINGTVFVPIFGEKNDKKALDIYRSFGLKVFGINSSILSNRGKGSLHCITMTYPKVPFVELKKIFK
jgi:agmatine/peptidylarginine deiminase